MHNPHGSMRDVAVLIGIEEPPCLQLAARELSRYLGDMLGCQVAVHHRIADAPTGARRFLLATPDSSLEVPDHLARRIRSADLGPDGCLAEHLHPYLLLAGSTGRGAAQAVWAYLEEYCHVGFFWSGDRLPEVTALPFEQVSFVQRPCFRERAMCPPGGYTLAEHLNWDDWKREINWRVHKRQNTAWGVGGELVWKQIHAELAGTPYVPSEADRLQDELYRKIAEYSRQRGLELIMPGFMGEVPAEFVARHPEVRYVGGLRWGGATTGELPMPKQIYPSDPMFHKLSSLYIRAYIERYGTPAYYFVPPFPEATVGDTPEEQHAVKIDLARAVQHVRDEICPTAVWLADTWTFLTAAFWPPEEVRAFCEAVNDRDRFRIYDTWGEQRPMWTLHNAYWGTSWWFGVLHCFGGNTVLRGDLVSLARDLRRIARDPRTARCVGVNLVPEAVHHNDLFFDLALRLGWDPDAASGAGDAVDLGAFLDDYALRRYGPRSAPAMRRVLDLLLETVYHTNDMTQPVYLQRLYTVLDFPNSYAYVPPEQMAWLPKLRRALQAMLRESRRQAGNPLYERDLVDVARRYLGDLFNALVPEVVHAWRQGERPRFEAAAQESQLIIEWTRDVLASSRWYRLQTRFDNTRHRGDSAALSAQTRNVMSNWEGSPYYDYERRDDFAELIEGYYLPRYRQWIDRLRSVPSESWSQVDDDWLTAKYLEIGRTWAREGKTLPAPSAPVAAMVRKALVVARALERPFPPVTPAASNLDFARGLRGWRLSSRRMSLAFEPRAGEGMSLAFSSWPRSSGANLYLFQTVRMTDARISLDCRLDACGASGFAGLRVEGYDASFRRVSESTYQWGDARDTWPDKYRPDNITPEWAIGASGTVPWHVGVYAIKRRLGSRTEGWQPLSADLSADLDELHGAGTWRRLGIRALRIALVASTRRRPEDPIAGAFCGLRVEPKH